MVVVLRLSHSAAWVSAVLVAHSLPYVVFKPLGGALADRADPRRLMVASDVGRLALQVLFAVLVAVRGPMPVVLLVVLATTTLGAPYASALSVTVAGLLPEDRLAAANAAFGALTYASIVGGPLVAGLVLAFAPDAAAFCVNAATFVVSAALVAAAPIARRPPRPAAGPTESLPAALGEAVRLVHRDVVLRGALALQACSTFVVGLGQVLFALVGRDLLGIGDAGLGWLVAATGVGGVLGTGIAARAARSPRVLAAMAVAGAAGAAPLALLAVVQSSWPAYVVLAAGGVGAVTIDVVTLTVLQRAVPRDRLGRVDGLVSGLGYGFLMLGNVAAPVLVSAFGLRGGLVAGAAAVAAVAAVVGIRLGGRQLRPIAPDALAVLSRVPTLHGLDAPAFEALAAACGAREEIAPGAVLLTAGERAAEVLVLVEGSCDVLATTEGGVALAEPRLVNRVQAPDLLGEIGVLQRRPRTATVVATSHGAVRRVPAADFAAVLVPHADAAGVVDTTVSARLARWSG